MFETAERVSLSTLIFERHSVLLPQRHSVGILIAATVDERASHKRKVANGIVSYDHQNPESFFSCEIDLSWI